MLLSLSSSSGACRSIIAAAKPRCGGSWGRSSKSRRAVLGLLSTAEMSTPPPPPSHFRNVTNGRYLNYAMLYHDSVAFLMSNDLGIPQWIASSLGADTGKAAGDRGGVTPAAVARQFDLSLRAASALLVTLCRMEVVRVVQDNDETVDEIAYDLTPEARVFLVNPESEASTCSFIKTFHSNFITPERLVECSRPVEQKDLMSEHLEETDEEAANNAQHFMRHMNGQSYSCAKALPHKLGFPAAKKPFTMLDVGGGSAIFCIQAAESSQHMKGIVFELPTIKPITEGYIAEANLSHRIAIHSGDFFTSEPFPSPVDVVLFSNILHDWPDSVNRDLLQKAFDCLLPAGRVVINELLLADDVKSSTSSATSMNIIMLPYTKGRQYRAKELYGTLEDIGFVNCWTEPLVDDYSLVVAEKP